MILFSHDVILKNKVNKISFTVSKQSTGNHNIRLKHNSEKYISLMPLAAGIDHSLYVSCGKTF